MSSAVIAASRPAQRVSGLDAGIAKATEALRSQQRQDGHFAFELEADATISSEYVLLKHFLGECDPALERKIATYI